MQAALSPALETALEYHLKVLAIAISYGGSELLQFRDKLKEAIGSAFQAPSWKVFTIFPNNHYQLTSCSFNFRLVMCLFLSKGNTSLVMK